MSEDRTYEANRELRKTAVIGFNSTGPLCNMSFIDGLVLSGLALPLKTGLVLVVVELRLITAWWLR